MARAEMKNVPHVDDASFETEVIQSELPVLVDFTGAWCPPCNQIAPFVDQLAGEYRGRAKVVMIDIDESTCVASRYGIRGVPTLLVFDAGKVVGQQTGAASKARIQRLIDAVLELATARRATDRPRP